MLKNKKSFIVFALTLVLAFGVFAGINGNWFSVASASEETIVCPTCHGTMQSQTICPECLGDCEGWYPCSSCGGSCKQRCDYCGGTGEDPDLGDICEYCGGDGLLDEDCWSCDGDGAVWKNCPTCEGTGTVDVDCTTCGKTGVVVPRLQIGTSKYYFLADAIEDVEEGGTITLLSDYSGTDVAPKKVKFQLDSNGFTNNAVLDGGDGFSVSMRGDEVKTYTVYDKVTSSKSCLATAGTVPSDLASSVWKNANGYGIYIEGNYAYVSDGGDVNVDHFHSGTSVAKYDSTKEYAQLASGSIIYNAGDFINTAGGNYYLYFKMYDGVLQSVEIAHTNDDYAKFDGIYGDLSKISDILADFPTTVDKAWEHTDPKSYDSIKLFVSDGCLALSTSFNGVTSDPEKFDGVFAISNNAVKFGPDYVFSYENVSVTFVSEGGELSSIVLSGFSGPGVVFNGTYEEASVIAEEILPEGFPICEGDIPSDAWINLGGSTLMRMGDSLYITGEESGDVFLIADLTTAILTKEGNDFSYTNSDDVKTVFTVDSQKKTVSITVSGATGEGSDHVNGTYMAPHFHGSGDDVVTFIPWNGGDGRNSMPTTAGNYALVNDITLSSTWEVPPGTTNLCLNGHVINVNGEDARVIEVREGETLNLYDCDTETEHNGYIDASGLWHFDATNSHVLTTGETAKTINGGIITGGAPMGNAGGIFVNKGTLNMFAGSIAGNKAQSGGGLSVYNGLFNMFGGSIVYNVGATNSAGLHISSSTFTMTDGAITDNVTTGNEAVTLVGGLYISGTSNVILGGSAKIVDNVISNGNGIHSANLGLYNSVTFSLGTGTGEGKNGVALPTSAMEIGVTMKAATGKFATDCTENDAKRFFSDSEDYCVCFNVGTEEAGDEYLELKKIYSVAEVLPDVFPTSDYDAWVAENGNMIYLDETNSKFVIDDGNGKLSFELNTELAYSGDDYLYSTENYSVKFVMKGGVLSSIVVQHEMQESYSGTYRPVVAYNYTTDTRYYSLAEAIAEAVEDDEIELWAEENDENIVLPLGVRLYVGYGYTGEITTTETGKGVCWQMNWGSYTIFVADVYDVIYKDMGGKAFSGTHAEGYSATYFEESETVLKDPTKAGYIFDGWYDNEECTGDPVSYLYAGLYFECNTYDETTKSITFYAKWSVGTQIDLREQGYENGVTTVTDISFGEGSPISGAFGKGTAANDPKYFLHYSDDPTSGAVRVYAGSTLTISATEGTLIEKIVFGFGFGEDDESNAILASEGTINGEEWTGSSKSVTFTVDGTSGHRRFATIKVYYFSSKVEKPTADETKFVFNGEEQTYEIAENDLYTVSGNVQTNVGTYTVTVALNDKEKYTWSDGKTDDLTFVFVINQKASDVVIKDKGGKVIENPEVSIIDAEGGIAPDAIFVVEVVGVEKVEDTKASKQALESKNKITNKEKIYGIYDAKLLIGTQEVQPNGKITIKMLVPEEVREKEFKLYHIHNGNEVYDISEYTAMDEEGYITFETDKLSQFAFVAENDASDVCFIHWILIAVLLIGGGLFAFFRFFMKKDLWILKVANNELYALITCGIGLVLSIVLLILGSCTVCTVFGIIDIVAFVCGILYILYKKYGDGIKNYLTKKPETEEQKVEEKQVEPIRETEVASNAEEIIEETEDDETETEIVYDENTGAFVRITYNKSITAKLIQSKDETKGYYGELKNYILSYKFGKKEIADKISWKHETFRFGRNLLVRMIMKGKTLCLCLPLDAKDYVGTKYHVDDMSEKKAYAGASAMFRIKNPRRAEYAKDLIDAVMLALGGEKTEINPVDYAKDYPYEELDSLIDKGLVKVVRNEESQANVKPLKLETVKTVSVLEADKMMADEQTKKFVQKSNRKVDKSRKTMVNVDVISKYFADGETVTLAELKKRIPNFDKKATYYKVCARGVLDKKLTIDADEFSVQAMKMILLTGGKVLSAK